MGTRVPKRLWRWLRWEKDSGAGGHRMLLPHPRDVSVEDAAGTGSVPGSGVAPVGRAR